MAEWCYLCTNRQGLQRALCTHRSSHLKDLQRSWTHGAPASFHIPGSVTRGWLFTIAQKRALSVWKERSLSFALRNDRTKYQLNICTPLTRIRRRSNYYGNSHWSHCPHLNVIPQLYQHYCTVCEYTKQTLQTTAQHRSVNWNHWLPMKLTQKGLSYDWSHRGWLCTARVVTSSVNSQDLARTQVTAFKQNTFK